MAYLYETATWRAIVKATRDPKLMAAFIVTTTAGAYALATSSEYLTTSASEQTKKEMEETIKKDYEARRYARHSKRALAVMFDTLKQDDGKVAKDTSQEPQIKLPGVMWHPRIAKREKEAQMQTKKPRDTKALPSIDRPPPGSTARSRRETS